MRTAMHICSQHSVRSGALPAAARELSCSWPARSAAAGVGASRLPRERRVRTKSAAQGSCRRLRSPLCAATSAEPEASPAAGGGAAPLDTSRSAAGGAAPALEWVEVGLVRSAHGLRGEVKVEPLTDTPMERLGTPGTRWLQQPEVAGRRRNLPPPAEVRLESGRETVSKGNEVWLVKLEGTDSPEEADLLRGCKLLIRPTDREPLEDEDEFYAQDLVGMTVVRLGGEGVLGKVVDIYDGTGCHDVIRVLLAAEDPKDARTVLVPFVKDIVPEVDLAARQMTVDPPEGLFDTSVPARRKRKNPRNKPPKL